MTYAKIGSVYLSSYTTRIVHAVDADARPAASRVVVGTPGDHALVADLAARLDNRSNTPLVAPVAPATGLERVADVPIYFADPLVRRAASLQRTQAARPPRARVHRTLLDQLGIHEGAQIRIRQGSGEAVVAVVVDPEVPPGVIRLAAAHASTTALEALSGPVIVERA